MDLLRRIRWNNVARAAAVLAAAGLVIAWPSLRSKPPALPPVEAVELEEEAPIEEPVDVEEPPEAEPPRRERTKPKPPRKPKPPVRRKRKPRRAKVRAKAPPTPEVEVPSVVPAPTPPAASGPVWQPPPPNEFGFEG